VLDNFVHLAGSAAPIEERKAGLVQRFAHIGMSSALETTPEYCRPSPERDGPAFLPHASAGERQDRAARHGWQGFDGLNGDSTARIDRLPPCPAMRTG
jgi:hypothetical protein